MNRRVLACTAFAIFSSARSNAQSEPLVRNDSERQLFESLNSERASHSLPPLQWEETLFKAARQHALRMVNLNMVEHQLPSEPNLSERLADAGARFGAIAENIAFGGSPRTIHDGWMDSPGHRKNILDPRLTSVGIAAVRGPGGLFAVEDFALSVSNFTVEEQEIRVAALLSKRGWHVGASKEEARNACETNQLEIGRGPRALVRFETADLSELPEGLEKRLRARPFRNALVGACRGAAAAGFARFRIAIVLY